MFEFIDEQTLKEITILRSIDKAGLFGDETPYAFRMTPELTDVTDLLIDYGVPDIDKQKTKGYQLVEFAKDSSGASLCLWNYPGEKHERNFRRPVVSLTPNQKPVMLTNQMSHFCLLMNSRLEINVQGLEDKSLDDCSASWLSYPFDRLRAFLKEIFDEETITLKDAKYASQIYHSNFANWIGIFSIKSIDTQTLKEIEMLNDIQDMGLFNGESPFDIEMHWAADVVDEIEDWGVDLESTEGHHLYQIAQNGDGSSLMLWDYPGRTDRMPLVMMGSEGETFNVANNLTDFCLVLNSYQSIFFFCNGNHETEKELRAAYPDYNFEALHAITHPVIGRGTIQEKDPKFNTNIDHPEFVRWLDPVGEWEDYLGVRKLGITNEPPYSSTPEGRSFFARQEQWARERELATEISNRE